MSPNLISAPIWGGKNRCSLKFQILGRTKNASQQRNKMRLLGFCTYSSRVQCLLFPRLILNADFSRLSLLIFLVLPLHWNLILCQSINDCRNRVRLQNILLLSSIIHQSSHVFLKYEQAVVHLQGIQLSHNISLYSAFWIRCMVIR